MLHKEKILDFKMTYLSSKKGKFLVSEEKSFIELVTG